MTSPVGSGVRGITDQRRLPRVGKLRLGVQVPNRSGNGTHPVERPYFVTDDDVAGRRFRDLFGAEPTMVPIVFPSDDPDVVARHNYECWGGGGRKCYGNGEQAEALVHVHALEEWRAQAQAAPDPSAVPPPAGLWASTVDQDQRTVARVVIPCLGMGYDGRPACPMYGNGCAITMHLQFVIPEYPELGVWQIDTGSLVSIEAVLNFLELLRAATGGHIGWIPLRIRRVPVKLRGVEHYVLRLESDLTLAHARQIGAPEARERLAGILGAPGADRDAPPPAALDEGALDVDATPPPTDEDLPIDVDSAAVVAAGHEPPRLGPATPPVRPATTTPAAALEHAGQFGGSDSSPSAEGAEQEPPPPAGDDAAAWQRAVDEQLQPVLHRVLVERFKWDDRAPHHGRQESFRAFREAFRDVPEIERFFGEHNRFELSPERAGVAGVQQAAAVLERFLAGENVRAEPFPPATPDQPQQAPLLSVTPERDPRDGGH